MIRVDPQALHELQVDHQPAVAERAAGNVVASAAHGYGQAVLASEAQGRDDVGDAGAASERRRTAVDGPVPDAAHLRVLRVTLRHNGASHGGS